MLAAKEQLKLILADQVEQACEQLPPEEVIDILSTVLAVTADHYLNVTTCIDMFSETVKEDIEHKLRIRAELKDSEVDKPTHLC